MGRRSDDGELILGGLVFGVVAVGAAIYLLMPVISVILIYGVPIVVVAALAIFEIESRPYPDIQDQGRSWGKVVYLDQETSRLGGIDEQQRQCAAEKITLYWNGDTHGLDRRNYDGRFAARGEGKRLNRQIEQIEHRFAELENERYEINNEALQRHLKQYRDFLSWRSRYARAIGARWSSAVYVLSALLLVLIATTLFRDFSRYIEQSMGVHALPFLFGPLFFASILAIIAALVGWNVNQSTNEVFFDSPTFERDSNIARFNEPEDFSEPAYSAHTAANEGEKAETEAEPNDASETKARERRSPYEILGIRPGSSRDEIVQAYRELIKQYHPDFQHGRGTKLQALAEKESQLLNWAKEEALNAL